VSERQIYASVNLKRLLPEVPRFFPSFESVLGEILQNAYRSGATEVVVEYDAAHNSLSIQDNGPGLDVPERLLVVGDAGWDESLVIDPAGMGAFATLRPEYVQMVVYESHGRWNWRLTVTPEVLTGGAAILTELASDGWCGLSVRLNLADSLAALDLAQLLMRCRGYYPFKLVFRNAAGEEERIDPEYEWQPELVIDLPVGRFEWNSRQWYHRRHETVWEYRRISSEAVERALKSAAERQTHPALAQALVDAQFRWFIDPACGVRPKLPDRHEILDDLALAQAAQAIVDALVERVLAVGREATATWPDRFELKDIGQSLQIPAQLLWLRHADRIARHLFPALGWKRVEHLVPAETRWYAMDEGDGAYLDRDEYLSVSYDRHARTVASEALSISLNLQGIPASMDERASDPLIAIHGFRGDPQNSPYVAFAGGIHAWNGGHLPWLLIPDMPDHIPWIPPEQVNAYRGQPVIFAGSPQDFLKALHNNDTFVNMIALQAIKEDFPDAWCGRDSGDVYFDEDQARATITLQVTEAFSPDLLAERKRYYSLVRLANALEEVHALFRRFCCSYDHHRQQHADLLASLLRPMVGLLQAGISLLLRLLSRHRRALRSRASVPPLTI
jgi:hypothetical protein